MRQEGVEFILRLKEQLSAGMRKAATSAQSSFNIINAKARQSERNMTGLERKTRGVRVELGMLSKPRRINLDTAKIDFAKTKTRELNRELDRAGVKARQLDNSVGAISGGSSGGRGMRLGGLAAGARRAAGIATMVGGAMAVGGVGYAANAGLKGGAQKVSMQTLAGEKEGTKLYGDLTKFAQESIYGNEVYQDAQMLLGYGVAVEKVMPTIKMLGDVAMGDKEKLNRLTLAMAQINAQGRLMGQDLLQLVNSGFNPLQEISKNTGLSMVELKKRMEDGAISAKMVEDAFKSATGQGGRFHNMTQKIAKTPFGKWEAAKGQMHGVALQAGEVLAPVIGELIDKVATPLLDSASKNIVPFTNELISFGREFAPMLKDIAGTTGDFFRSVGSTLASQEMRDLAKASLVLANDMGQLLVPVMRDLGTLIKPIAGGLADLFETMHEQKLTMQQQANERVQGWRDQGLLPKKPTAKMAGDMLANVSAIDPRLGAQLRKGGFRFDQHHKGGGEAGSTTAGAVGTGTGADASFSTSAADRITRGGPKQVTYNFHAPLVDNTTINAADSVEAFAKLDEKVAESILRITGSAHKN